MSNPEIMWSKAFAWNATNKNTIQDERQPSQDVQDATLNDGFPLITMTPQDAGGIAPNGQDMNGALYAISSNMVHRQKGLRIQFDPAYAAKIGGYDQGCILASNDYTRDYISLIPNNLTDPNGSGTAGRWAIYSGAGSIASATASIAGIVKIVDSLSSTATDAALTANQGKVLGDRTQQATTTNVGISRFANSSEVANKSNSNVAINPSNAATIAQSTDLGVGQTWQNVTGSRSSGQTYRNNTGKPIHIFIAVKDGVGGGLKLVIGGVTIFNFTYDLPQWAFYPVSVIIPDNTDYSFTWAGNNPSDLLTWSELR
jgi:hypothetical protein